MMAFLFAMQQVAPPIESVFPDSVGGWVAMITGIVAVVLLLYDRLRGSGKLDADLHNKVNELKRQTETMEREFNAIETQLIPLDKRLAEVLFELRGFDGTNGMKGLSKAQAIEIASIKQRLAAMDVVAALFKAERENYSGEERRHTTRRMMDSKIVAFSKPEDDDDGN